MNCDFVGKKWPCKPVPREAAGIFSRYGWELLRGGRVGLTYWVRRNWPKTSIEAILVRRSPHHLVGISSLVVVCQRWPHCYSPGFKFQFQVSLLPGFKNHILQVRAWQNDFQVCQTLMCDNQCESLRDPWMTWNLNACSNSILRSSTHLWSYGGKLPHRFGGGCCKSKWHILSAQASAGFVLAKSLVTGNYLSLITYNFYNYKL